VGCWSCGASEVASARCGVLVVASYWRG